MASVPDVRDAAGRIRRHAAQCQHRSIPESYDDVASLGALARSARMNVVDLNDAAYSWPSARTRDLTQTSLPSMCGHFRPSARVRRSGLIHSFRDTRCLHQADLTVATGFEFGHKGKD